MITEDIIVGKGSQWPLNGKLTLPDKTDLPVPAVVLVHGSGSSDMNEKVMKLTPFKDLAEGLAAYGIASVRYDKRSYAHGRKLIRLPAKEMTVRAETIEDAILAADLLRQDSRIDPDRIFIIGHSMGAMLAPRIDAEGGSFRGLILMAGSPRSLGEIMQSQTEEMMQGSGGFKKWVIGKATGKMLGQFRKMDTLSDEEACAVKMSGGTTLYYFKEMNGHPASQYLLANEKPVLIMQGGKDFQALPETDYQGYKELLKERPNVTYKYYETLNHCFVLSLYGKDINKAGKEYAKERHIPDQVIRDIAYWIQAN